MVPPNKTIVQHTVLYAFLCVWSLYQASASGPAFQVALSLALTAYLVYSKRVVKNVWPAMGQALLGMFGGYLLGSVVPVYLPVFPSTLSPETIAALFSFVAMWVAATFFK